MRRWLRLAFMAQLAAGAGVASAGETISYTYDALGRVVAVQHSGTVNARLRADYQFDPVDNRKNVTVSGATRVIVVPLLGLSVLVTG